MQTTIHKYITAIIEFVKCNIKLLTNSLQINRLVEQKLTTVNRKMNSHMEFQRIP